MTKKPLKIGASLGSGDPPLQWTVVVLQVAFDEAMSFLSREQYRHLAREFQELATQGDPTHSATISLDKVEEFFELRDYGGVLYPRNVRIFFGIDDKKRRIVVLMSLDKRNDGPTPLGARNRARDRWRRYLRGEFD